MSPEQSLKNGDLTEALGSLQQRVRVNPGDAPDRIFLFQLLAVLGDWKRAKTQLSVAAEIDPSLLLTAGVYGGALEAELQRASMFRDQRNPRVIGEPPEWLAWLFEANRLFLLGKVEEATVLRSAAFDAAPAQPGRINGLPFEWIADADPRFGPCIELIMQDKYYWIPMAGIRRLTLERPTQLRDLVWMPAIIEWQQGSQVTALIPTRYPGTEISDEGPLRLAKATSWTELHSGWTLGSGQRLFASDGADVALCDLRRLEFDPQREESPSHEQPLSER